jgi:hypothetical protein
MWCKRPNVSTRQADFLAFWAQEFDLCDFMKDVFSVSWLVSPLPTLVFATECVTGQDPELLKNWASTPE